MGRFHGIVVDIDRVRVVADFEVIQIVDDSNPYLKLLILDWAFDIDAIIDLREEI